MLPALLVPLVEMTYFGVRRLNAMGNPSIFFRDDVDPANELNMEERCGLGWGILGHRSEMDGPETSRDKFLLHLLHMYVHVQVQPCTYVFDIGRNLESLFQRNFVNTVWCSSILLLFMGIWLLFYQAVES